MRLGFLDGQRQQYIYIYGQGPSRSCARSIKMEKNYFLRTTKFGPSLMGSENMIFIDNILKVLLFFSIIIVYTSIIPYYFLKS